MERMTEKELNDLHEVKHQLGPTSQRLLDEVYMLNIEKAIAVLAFKMIEVRSSSRIAEWSWYGATAKTALENMSENPVS